MGKKPEEVDRSQLFRTHNCLDLVSRLLNFTKLKEIVKIFGAQLTETTQVSTPMTMLRKRKKS